MKGKKSTFIFVAETKGDMSSMEFRKIEDEKNTAQVSISVPQRDNVKYDIDDSYDRCGSWYRDKNRQMSDSKCEQENKSFHSHSNSLLIIDFNTSLKYNGVG
jgi:hypothetical protein